MNGVMERDGAQWWTTAYAMAQLRVDQHRLSDWVRRSRAAGHTGPAAGCGRCATGPDGRWFPHVDPPTRSGRLWGYVAEQLLDAEEHTARGTRGGRVRADV